MTAVNRISAPDAKARVDAGQSLLVCIYDDDKFNSQAHLEGAIPMSEFLKIKPDLSKDTDIIFY
ncbi:MAG: ArsR family transcriptional regulator [Deltaproteobacteria bacterium]|uniref:rhodanese-like domain-containing protein n=1 Tax=Desulfobacula sp. TaxID=2593537 RepID=UPI0019A48C52|nr:ArsR family transcriptional regulator [Candidatus Desulfobacula maris]MBL6994439.1 ArsR family transcriptional regulator [Desulfobacula sp.]